MGLEEHECVAMGSYGSGAKHVCHMCSKAFEDRDLFRMHLEMCEGMALRAIRDDANTSGGKECAPAAAAATESMVSNPTEISVNASEKNSHSIAG